MFSEYTFYFFFGNNFGIKTQRTLRGYSCNLGSTKTNTANNSGILRTLIIFKLLNLYIL